MQNQIRMESKWLSRYPLLRCSQINGLTVGQIIRNPLTRWVVPPTFQSEVNL